MMPAMPEPSLSDITCVLGFDYGKQRIGIASGQRITASATPQVTVRHIDGNPDWNSIETQIATWKPQALIVGMPFHMDGSENKMTRQAQDFGSALKKRFRLPVFYVDERLSSAEAETQLKTHHKINQQNKHEIDKMAAAIIVQRWLDNHL